MEERKQTRNFCSSFIKRKAKRVMAMILTVFMAISSISYGGIITANAQGNTYDISAGAITINNSNLSTYNNSVITGASNSNMITIDGVTANLTFSNLNLNIESSTSTTGGWYSAIKLTNGATLNLTITGDNTVTGGTEHAAINVPEGCSLVITQDSTGTLIATAGNGSAGIGADFGGTNDYNIKTVGNITIDGGTVKAYGRGGGAGIGGTSFGKTGNIKINGGTVYAKGGGGILTNPFFYAICGSGIGGGSNGYVESITITGGNVIAIGGHRHEQLSNFQDAPATGIGCGSATGITSDYKNTCGIISIIGGAISATGGNNNAVNAIGYGLSPDFDISGDDFIGSVTISDNALVNTNGGAIHPLSNTVSPNMYKLAMTIYDGRLTKSIEGATIKVNGKTYLGDIKVNENYVGTISCSLLYNGVITGEQTVEISSGDYSWNTTVNFTGGFDYTSSIGSELYPVYLWFYDAAITSDISGVSLSVKQNGNVLNSNPAQGIAQFAYDKTITKYKDGVGKMTAYIPAESSELTATVPRVNGGGAITVSDKIIKASSDGTIIILWDNNATPQLSHTLDLSYGNITFVDNGGKLDITYTPEAGGGATTVTGQYYQNEYEILQSNNTTTATTNQIIFQNTTDVVNVKLNGVNMQSMGMAIDLHNSKAKLNLSGTNIIDCGGAGDVGDVAGDAPYYIGIHAASGTELTLEGNGSLEVKNPSYYGVGIGGYYYYTMWVNERIYEGAGTIRIQGGNLNVSGKQGAGIGSSCSYQGDDFGSIYITGGTVNATGNRYGAAIGGSNSGKPSNVYITGGRITAKIESSSSFNGAAIGSGSSGNPGGEISISGGYVEATAMNSQNTTAIGGGYRGVCPNITISGGTIKATGGKASIGTSESGWGGSLKITGGTISTINNEKPTINLTPTKDGTTPVYYTTVNVDEIYGKDAFVNNASITGCDYGFTDVKTDANGVLHLYLPASTADTKTEASFNNVNYSGIITSGDSNVLKLPAVFTAEADTITGTGASLHASYEGSGSVYYVASSTELTTGSQVENASGVQSMTMSDGIASTILSGLKEQTEYTYYLVVKIGDVYSNVISVTFTTKKSSNLQPIGTVDGKVFDDTPISHSTTKGDLFTWDGNGTISFNYFVDNNGTKTTAANSGAASEGAAPKNIGSYYLKATLSENGEYGGAETDYIPFTIKSPLSGTGTQIDPYIIETANGLSYLANSVRAGQNYYDKYFKLNNDITYSSVPIGCFLEGSSTNSPFCGNFDGAGHTVTLAMTNANSGMNQAVALFGYLGSGAIVENISTTGTITSAGKFSGGIAGAARDGAINISNCWSNVEMNFTTGGDATYGGIVGLINNSGNVTMTNCCFTGKITTSGTSLEGVGGLCGWKSDTLNAVNCYVDASFGSSTITAKGEYMSRNGGVFTDCYYNKEKTLTDDGSAASTGIEAVTNDFTSGKIAWLLQDGQSNKAIQAWGQNLTGATKDSDPVLSSASAKAVHKVSYYQGSQELVDCSGYVNSSMILPALTLTEQEKSEGYRYSFEITSGNATLDTANNQLKDIGGDVSVTVRKEIFVEKANGRIAIKNDYKVSYLYTGNMIAEPTESQIDKLGDGKVTFEWYDGKNEDGTVTGLTKCNSAPVEVGNYTLKAIIAESTNYKTACTTVLVTITEPEYIISASSKDITGADTSAVPTGLGSYVRGTFATVEAPIVTSYNFVGWYQAFGEVPGYTGNILCKNRVYTFKVTENTNLVAVYNPLATANVIINGGNSYTINGSEYTSQNTDSYSLGSTVTVKVNNTVDFAYWTNEHGMILSRNASYTFTVTGTMTLTAVYNTKIENKSMIIFESYYGQVISRMQLGSSDTFTLPDRPTRYGYTFTGWSMTEQKIKDEISAGTAVIKVIPVYELINKSYTITVVGGTGSGSYNQNDVVTATANAPEAGKKFSHWTDADGNILSYSTTYKFYATKNVEITANYVVETTVVEAKGTAQIIDIKKDIANSKISFVSMLTVPEGCTIQMAGIIATNVQEVGTSGDGFNKDTAKYVRGNAWSGKACRYTWTKKVTATETWYVRAYLVYKDTNGNLVTVYGDMVTAKLND